MKILYLVRGAIDSLYLPLGIFNGSAYCVLSVDYIWFHIQNYIRVFVIISITLKYYTKTSCKNYLFVIFYRQFRRWRGGRVVKGSRL